MLDMGFIHAIRKIVGAAAEDSARPCSSRPPCRTRSQALPTTSSPIRCASRSRRWPPRSSASSSRSIYRRSGQQARALLADAARRPADRPRPRLHPHQARRRPGGEAPLAGDGIAAEAIHGNKSQNAPRARAGRLPGRQGPRARGHRHRRPRHRRRRRHARRQLRSARRAGEPMSTASAARPAPGPTASAIAFCTPEERGLLRDIEKHHPRPGSGAGTRAWPSGRAAACPELRLEPGRQGQARRQAASPRPEAQPTSRVRDHAT